MADSGQFSIGEFARLSLLTRDTLLHYDKIALLSPEKRGENNYRYYSSNQLSVVTLIRTMQELGMSLEEIKELKDRRTPELCETELKRQIEKIDRKIVEWNRARKLLLTLQKTLDSVKNIDESAITVQFLPKEAIVLGDLNDYSRGRTTLETVYSFYTGISEKYPYIDLNYFLGAIFTEERIKQGDWIGADRYYMYNPEGPDRRSAALYAIGYTRCDYTGGKELYTRMIRYIDENGYEICGDAFEECPLNEVFIIDPDNYLKRIMITIRKKEK